MKAMSPTGCSGEETIELRPASPGRRVSGKGAVRASRVAKRRAQRRPAQIAAVRQGLDQIDLDLAEMFPTDAVCGLGSRSGATPAGDEDVGAPLSRGQFSSGYHWKEGIGPVESRPEKPNPAWPEWEPNRVGDG